MRGPSASKNPSSSRLRWLQGQHSNSRVYLMHGFTVDAACLSKHSTVQQQCFWLAGNKQQRRGTCMLRDVTQPGSSKHSRDDLLHSIHWQLIGLGKLQGTGMPGQRSVVWCRALYVLSIHHRDRPWPPESGACRPEPLASPCKAPWQLLSPPLVSLPGVRNLSQAL